MNFNYELEIAAGTKESDPEKKVMNLSFGILTKVYIIIPDGHVGLAHLKIMYHESQLYPLPPSDDYHGDGNEISFADRQPIFINPYELKATGWNEDDTYKHSFLMNFTITRPETLGIPSVAPAVLELVRNLVGAELIIPLPEVPGLPPVPKPEQGLIIMSSPSYARIYIDGEDTGKLTRETIMLNVGKYNVRLEKDEYISWSKTIDINRGEVQEVRAELEAEAVIPIPPSPPPLAHGIYLSSSPSRSAIYIDGVDTLKLTPERLELEPGDYAIHVERAGYLAFDRTIRVVEGIFIEVHAILVKDEPWAPPEERQGLEIMSYPTYASIFIDGYDTGRLTKDKIATIPGTHAIKIAKAGYHVWQSGRTVVEGQWIEVMAVLTPTGEPIPGPPPGPPGPEPEPPIPLLRPVEWLYAASTENRVELKWKPVLDEIFQHYNVYRDAVLLGTTTERVYEDTDVEIGKTYKYRVTPTDIYNRESLWNGYKMVTIKEYVVPERPEGKAWLIVRGIPPTSRVTSKYPHYWGDTRLEPEALYVPILPGTNHDFTISRSGYETLEVVVRAEDEEDTQYIDFNLKRRWWPDWEGDEYDP